MDSEPQPQPEPESANWVAESWATRRGSHQAVKLTVMFDHEPSATELEDLRSKVSGLFRVLYGEWADDLGRSVWPR